MTSPFQKRFLLSLLIIGLSTVLVGQRDTTVYLKDGSILKGKVLENTDFLIKMELAMGDTVTVGYKHINQGGPTIAYRQRRMRKHKTDGILIAFHTDFLVGNDGAFKGGVSIGKRINDIWNVGGTIQYSDYNVPLSTLYLEPSYVSMLGFVRKYWNRSENNKRYYSILSLGLGLPIGEVNFLQFFEDYDILPELNLGFGIHFASRKKTHFLLEGGVQYAHMRGFAMTDFSPTGIDNLEISFVNNIITPYIGAKLEF